MMPMNLMGDCRKVWRSNSRIGLPQSPCGSDAGNALHIPNTIRRQQRRAFCLSDSSSPFLQACLERFRNEAHVRERIVKKLTNAQAPNRLAGRVPESEATSTGGLIRGGDYGLCFLCSLLSEGFKVLKN